MIKSKNLVESHSYLQLLEEISINSRKNINKLKSIEHSNNNLVKNLS